MKRPRRDEVFSVLRERSTIAGIAGLSVALLGLFGVHANEALVSEIILLLISIVAIATRPRKENGYSIHRRDGHASYGPGRVFGDHGSREQARSGRGREKETSEGVGRCRDHW